MNAETLADLLRALVTETIDGETPDETRGLAGAEVSGRPTDRAWLQSFGISFPHGRHFIVTVEDAS